MGSMDLQLVTASSCSHFKCMQYFVPHTICAMHPAKVLGVVHVQMNAARSLCKIYWRCYYPCLFIPQLILFLNTIKPALASNDNVMLDSVMW